MPRRQAVRSARKHDLLDCLHLQATGKPSSGHALVIKHRTHDERRTGGGGGGRQTVNMYNQGRSDLKADWWGQTGLLQKQALEDGQNALGTGKILRLVEGILWLNVRYAFDDAEAEGYHVSQSCPQG